MEYVIAGLLFVGLSFLFIGLYVLNKRTPKPEGCEQADLEECSGCAMKICPRHPKDQKEEE